MNDRGIVLLGSNGTLGSTIGSLVRQKGWQSLRLDRHIPQSGDPLIDIECDLASADSISKAVSNIPWTTARDWKIIIASGVFFGADHDPRLWDQVDQSLQINLVGVVHFVFASMAALSTNRARARYVVTTSAAARIGSSDLPYGVAKAGLEGLVRSGAKVGAPHFTFVGVAPGYFRSGMSKQQSARRTSAAIRANRIGRAVSVDEVAQCVFFAAFDAPEALTGTFISPNGGQIGA